jgi:hypothetical protein
MPVRCIRLYADAEGESHFDDTEIPLNSVDFAPPAPPLDVSEVKEAKYGFLRAPAGWFGDWHPAPQKQVMCLLSGVLEVGVSDGETRRIESGTVTLVEDTTGVGHTSRVVSAEPVLMIFAQVS